MCNIESNYCVLHVKRRVRHLIFIDSLLVYYRAEPHGRVVDYVMKTDLSIKGVTSYKQIFQLTSKA